MALHYHRSDDLMPNQGYEQDISTQLLRFGCAICGRPLRDPVSLERGWGPVCDENFMGGAGEAAVWARMHAEFDPVEAAAAIREAPTIEPTRWLEPIIDQATGKPKIEAGPWKKGETLPDGTVALGGEIQVATRTLKPGSLRDYWIKRGGDPSDPQAEWRTSPETRRLLVSNGIWYASRAVTYGFDADVIGAQKVDPRWMVVASVQRFARAVGLPGAANRMTEFYSVQVVKQIKEIQKERAKATSKKTGIVFERVPDDYRVEMWDEQARRKATRPVGSHTIRLHVPYSKEFNDLAWQNKDIFFAKHGEPEMSKDQAYFWRYFHQKDLRQVVNIVQGVFGDRVCVSRDMVTPADRLAAERSHRGKVRVLDVTTQTIRAFPPETAQKLVEGASYDALDSKGKPGRREGRYRILKD